MVVQNNSLEYTDVKQYLLLLAFSAKDMDFFDEKKNIYIVAGAGGGAVLIIVILILFFCCRQKRKKRIPKENPVKRNTIVGSDSGNKEMEEELDDLVMEENILYAGYTDGFKVTEKANKDERFSKTSPKRPRKITDAYAQVNKINKSKNGAPFQLQQESGDTPIKEREHSTMGGGNVLMCQ